MSKRLTGVTFISIAAFLYGIRYLSASVFGSNVSSWNEQLFQAMLNSVGKTPLYISILALIVGIGYLLWAEIESFQKR